MEKSPLFVFLETRNNEINNQIQQLQITQSEIVRALAFEEQRQYKEKQDKEPKDIAVSPEPYPMSVDEAVPYNRHRKG